MLTEPGFPVWVSSCWYSSSLMPVPFLLSHSSVKETSALPQAHLPARSAPTILTCHQYSLVLNIHNFFHLHLPFPWASRIPQLPQYKTKTNCKTREQPSVTSYSLYSNTLATPAISFHPHITPICISYVCRTKTSF